MREQNPFLLRDDLHQVLLNLHGVGILRQIQPARDTLHMRIYHDPGGHAISRTKHTFAVLPATPGTSSNSSMVRGTLPRKLSRIFLAAPINALALLLKKPVDRMSWASSSCDAFAKSSIVGYFSKSPGVTLLTRSSVH